MYDAKSNTKAALLAIDFITKCLEEENDPEFICSMTEAIQRLTDFVRSQYGI